MTMKAVGLNPQGLLSHWLCKLAVRLMQFRFERLVRAGV